MKVALIRMWAVGANLGQCQAGKTRRLSARVFDLIPYSERAAKEPKRSRRE